MAQLLMSAGFRDKLLVASVIGLGVVAHLLPVAVGTEPGSESYGDRMDGWSFSQQLIWYYENFARDAWHGAPHDWFAFVGFLSNPLFWLGTGTLLIGYRVGLRVTGFISGLAGISALACTLAFLFTVDLRELRLLVGF